MVGAGARGKLDAAALRKIVDATLRALKGSKAKDALMHIEELGSDEMNTAALCELLGRKAVVASYGYSETLSKPKPKLSLSRLQVNTGKAMANAAANRMLKLGKQIGEGINVARELGT